jgi:hypothetical protein
MFRMLTVASSIVAASLLFAPMAVAMPSNECARLCSDRHGYKNCMADCLSLDTPIR